MKLYSLLKWTLLHIVRPLVTLWIVFNGLPPSIRAFFSGLNSLIKLLR